MSRESGDILGRLRAGYSLPALSVVAAKLIELASDENASVRDLTELIEKDPSLTVRLIRIANSAFFRTAEAVTSVEQAVFRIGFNRLRIMALSLSLRDTFPMGKRGNMDYEQFWKVSLYKALLSKALALHLNNCNPDEAFVAGLVQETGLIILLDLFMNELDKTVEPVLFPLDSLLASETETYGINHREVGEIALRYWKFPESIISCQRFSLEKGETPSPLYTNCEIAGLLSSIIFQHSVDLNELLKEISGLYKISSETASDILSSVFNEVEETARAFRVDVNSEKDMLGIMEKANMVLGKLSEQLSYYNGFSQDRVLPTFKSLDKLDDREVIDHTLQAVAHEIRNPLVSVGGFVKKLSRVMDSSSKGWEYVQIILEETRKMEQALSRMSANK